MEKKQHLRCLCHLFSLKKMCLKYLPIFAQDLQVVCTKFNVSQNIRSVDFNYRFIANEHHNSHELINTNALEMKIMKLQIYRWAWFFFLSIYKIVFYCSFDCDIERLQLLNGMRMRMFSLKTNSPWRWFQWISVDSRIVLVYLTVFRVNEGQSYMCVCVCVLEFRLLYLPFAPWNSVNLKHFWNRHCANSFGLRCFRNARTSARTFSKDSMVEWIVYRYSHKTTAKCLLYSCAHPFSGVAWESLSC